MNEPNDNPNENCLEGMACPKCGHFGPFSIEVTQSGPCLVSDSGTDFIDGNVEWDESSGCGCRQCEFSGTVADFKQFDAYQKTVLAHYNDGDFDKLLRSEIPDCGDTLLKFLLIELSEAEDCLSPEDAVSRLDTAIEQLMRLRKVFEEMA